MITTSLFVSLPSWVNANDWPALDSEPPGAAFARLDVPVPDRPPEVPPSRWLVQERGLRARNPPAADGYLILAPGRDRLDFAADRETLLAVLLNRCLEGRLVGPLAIPEDAVAPEDPRHGSAWTPMFRLHDGEAAPIGYVTRLRVPPDLDESDPRNFDACVRAGGVEALTPDQKDYARKVLAGLMATVNTCDIIAGAGDDEAPLRTERRVSRLIELMIKDWYERFR